MRPNLGADYAQYKASLAAQGVSRRSQYDKDIAWFHSMLLSYAPMVALLQQHAPLRVPEVPSVPTQEELHAEARRDLKSRGEYRWWSGASRARVAKEAETLRSSISEQRRALAAKLNDAYRRFTDLDPAMNLVVLQAAFADNGGTAAPVDLDGDSLLVFMSFPDAAHAIWPEKTSRTPSGKDSVKKRTNAEIHEEYRWQLRCHVAGTAREAFMLQPGLRSCRVVVMLEDLDWSLAELPVLLDATFDREKTLDVARTSYGWEPAWNRTVELWEADTDVNTMAVAWNVFAEYIPDLENAREMVYRTLFVGDSDLEWKKSGVVVPIDTLQGRFPGVDLAAFGAADDDHAYSAPVEAVAETPEAFLSHQFWLDALAVAEAWSASAAK